MRGMRWLLIFALLLARPAAGRAAEKAAGYGVPVRYARGQTLRFADFALTPLGTRRVTPPQYPRGWEVHEFRVEGGGATQVVRWSGGTGDIGPARFQCAGKVWDLERVWNRAAGKLREDELVITPGR